MSVWMDSSERRGEVDHAPLVNAPRPIGQEKG